MALSYQKGFPDFVKPNEVLYPLGRVDELDAKELADPYNTSLTKYRHILDKHYGNKISQISTWINETGIGCTGGRFASEYDCRTGEIVVAIHLTFKTPEEATMFRLRWA